MDRKTFGDTNFTNTNGVFTSVNPQLEHVLKQVEILSNQTRLSNIRREHNELLTSLRSMNYDVTALEKLMREAESVFMNNKARYWELFDKITQESQKLSQSAFFKK